MNVCTPMAGVVRVRRLVLDAMLAEARIHPGIECCGLLAGREGLISTAFPARNALASATAYEIAPKELFALFRRMREEGLEHLGIYHSHPNGENSPSPSDVERAYYPDAAYFIIAPQADHSTAVRAFRIAGGKAGELKIETA